MTFVFEFVSLHVGVCLHVCSDACVHACGGQIPTLDAFLQELATDAFETGFLSSTWNVPGKLGWLAKDAQGFPESLPSSVGITNMLPHPALL